MRKWGLCDYAFIAKRRSCENTLMLRKELIAHYIRSHITIVWSLKSLYARKDTVWFLITLNAWSKVMFIRPYESLWFPESQSHEKVLPSSKSTSNRTSVPSVQDTLNSTLLFDKINTALDVKLSSVITNPININKLKVLIET